MYQVVDCTQRHDREVAALINDPAPSGAPYPGVNALVAEGRQSCPAQVRAYTGGSFDPTQYSPRFYYPRQTNWDSGERTIVCVLSSLGGPRTGSVQSGAAVGAVATS